VLGISEDPLVSSDIIREPRPSVIDLGMSQVAGIGHQRVSCARARFARYNVSAENLEHHGRIRSAFTSV